MFKSGFELYKLFRRCLAVKIVLVLEKLKCLVIKNNFQIMIMYARLKKCLSYVIFVNNYFKYDS